MQKQCLKAMRPFTKYCGNMFYYSENKFKQKAD